MKLIKAAANVTSISAGAGVGGLIGYALSERHFTETIPRERDTTNKEPQYDEKLVERPLDYSGQGLIVGYNVKDKIELVPVTKTSTRDQEHKIESGQNLWGITNSRYLDLRTDQEVAGKVNEVATYPPNVKANPEILLDTKAVVDGRVVSMPDGILGDEIFPGRMLILPQVPTKVSASELQVTGKELTYQVREFLGVKEIPVKESYMEPHQVTAYDLNFALMGALVGAGVITSIYGLGKGVRRLFSNGRGERIAEAGVVITTFGTISHEVYRLAGVLSDPDKVNQALRNLEQVLNYVPKFL